MVPLLRFLVPLTIIGFYFWRLGTRNPLILVALPLTLTLGEAAFMQSWGFGMGIPFFPYPVSWPDVVLGALVIAWVYVRQKRPQAKPIQWTLESGVAGLLLLGLLLYVPLSWVEDQAIKVGVFWAARGYIYMPLSIFIWVDVFRRVTREETEQLLETMALATVPLAGMYALSSVGVPIFPDLSWAPTYYGSAVIVRDFMTFPVWTRFALAYFLTRPRQTMTMLVSIGVLTAGVVLSYTRSWIVPAGVVFMIAVFYISVVRQRFALAIPRLIGVALILVSAIGILGFLFPENMQYATDRVAELATEGFFAGNVVARSSVFDEVNYYVQSTDPTFGAGFAVAAATEAQTISDTYFVGDMLWTTLLLTLGWVGIILFGLLLAVCGIRAFWLMLDWGDAARARFATILCMVLAWDSIRVFASSEYVQLQQTSSALCFALVIVEAQRLWAENPMTLPRLPLFQGITLDWFSRDDEYWLLRRAALAVLVGFIVVLSVRFVVR